MESKTSPAINSLIKYNPQLDGLRFFAVLFVVSYHWLPSISKNEVSPFFASFVNFFFVLSSYLITKILFSARDKGGSMNISRLKILFVFFIRRVIRIFPAYYVFLTIIALLPVYGNEVRHNAQAYIIYLANFHIYHSHVWPLVTAHLWTLAVEEQFYLVWPFLILFIPHKYLLHVFSILIIGSVILRALFFSPGQVVPQFILTQFSIDPFAIGGLLAYKYTIPSTARINIDKILNIVLYPGILLTIIIIMTKSHYLSFTLNGLLFSIISYKIIDGAINRYENSLGSFLENKIVLFIGRISYGIYLYHLLVPIIFWDLFNKAYAYLDLHYHYFLVQHQEIFGVFFRLIGSEVACFVIYALCSVFLASISWYLIEKPFSKLRVFSNLNRAK